MKEKGLYKSVIIFVAFFVFLVVIVGNHVIPMANAQPKPIVWKGQSHAPAANPIHLCSVEAAKDIGKMSGGRLKWELMPAGSIVPPFEMLDAINKGVLDASISWPNYWVGKHPAFALFSATIGGPFGLHGWSYLSWLFAGGGEELYNELIQKEMKLNVVAIHTAYGVFPELYGWCTKPISSLEDIKGVKFRTAGLNAELLRKLGGIPVVLGPGEILPSMERKVVEGAEWATPAGDKSFGFHTVAKNYIAPSFHQPSNVHELIINKKRWEELPPDLQAIVKGGMRASVTNCNAWHLIEDAKAFEELVTKHGVKIVRLSDEVLKAQLKGAKEVLEEYAAKNPFFKRVLEHQRKFAENMARIEALGEPPWDMASEFYFGIKKK